MSLKRQLFLLGLLTLVLPWLALRYMDQVDITLRQMRLENLQELAENTRRLLLQQPELTHLLAARNAAVPATFAAPIVADMRVDGYLTEWLAFNGRCAAAQCAAKSFVDLPVGIEVNWLSAKGEGARDGLYLALALKRLPPVWFQPGVASDALILRFNDEAFKLQAARPGGGFVLRKALGAQKWQRDYASQAFWRVNNQEYSSTIEWRLPASVKNKPFTLELASAQLGYSLFATANNQAIYWAFYEQALAPSIAPLLGPEQRLMLFDARGYPAVEAGELELGYGLPLLGARRSWLMRWYLYFFNKPATQYQKPGIPLQQEHTAQWLFNHIAPVARVTIPLFLTSAPPASARPSGWLVMDRQEPRFDAMLADIYSEFLLLCVAFAAVVVLLLVGFASLHSLRIRRLASSAQRTLNTQGDLDARLIAQNFKASKAPDEIGQLSRSLSVLLLRLGAQQEYLRNLAGTLSHELRTPIAVIQSSLDNLHMSRLDQKSLLYVRRADDGAKRLSRTLNAMSAANALEQSLKSAERERFDMKQLLKDIGAAYQATYAPQKIDLIIEDRLSLEEEEPWWFDGSPELLVQMFDKLIENACQFAAPNTVLSMTCWRFFGLAQGEAFIGVSLANIGPKLPEGMEQQVFDSMVSVRQQAVKGGADDQEKPLHLGLGLYVARLICLFHRGGIRAFNAPYHCAEHEAVDANDAALGKVTFEVTLPINSLSAH